MEQLVRYPPAHKNRQGEVEMCLRSPGSGQNYRLASPPAPALRSAGLKHVVLQAVAILVPPPAFPLFLALLQAGATRTLQKGSSNFPKQMDQPCLLLQ